MTATRTPLHLERPSFWTESNDSEAWFRALDAIQHAAASKAQTGTPRTVAERCLVGIIAWRGATGLFGAFRRQGRWLLPGVGLVACDESGHWDLTDAARGLLHTWMESPSDALVGLAAYLVRESPWLRLLLLRLQAGDWELANWADARQGRAGLVAGSSLRLCNHSEPECWFVGLEQETAARWLARTECHTLAYAPDLLKREKSKDNLSLSPLTAPLYLLEAVGWLTGQGEFRLPNELMGDLVGQASPAQTLDNLTRRYADGRGFVPAEPVLRELLAVFGVSPPADAFASWMDALINQSVQRGALELLDEEPGQARHGRGLQADRSRKLVRWVVHPEFNDIFQNAWPLLESQQDLKR